MQGTTNQNTVCVRISFTAGRSINTGYNRNFHHLVTEEGYVSDVPC